MTNSDEFSGKVVRRMGQQAEKKDQTETVTWLGGRRREETVMRSKVWTSNHLLSLAFLLSSLLVVVLSQTSDWQVTYHGLKERRVFDVGGLLIPSVELRLGDVQRVPSWVALLLSHNNNTHNDHKLTVKYTTTTWHHFMTRVPCI